MDIVGCNLFGVTQMASVGERLNFHFGQHFPGDADLPQAFRYADFLAQGSDPGNGFFSHFMVGSALQAHGATDTRQWGGGNI
jgi:hypothetical protein